MSLRINLYHEILRARKQQQYDPLKLTMLGLLVIAIGLAGYYLMVSAEVSGVRREASALQNEIFQLKPKAAEASNRETDLSKQIALSEAFTKRMEHRFYWAPVLERVALTVPRSVQVGRMSADISSEGEARRCQVSLDGVAAGAEPRQTAEELRMALVERFGEKYKDAQATFKSLEDSQEIVQLDGQKLRTAQFTITLTFHPAKPETETSETETAQVAQQPL